MEENITPEDYIEKNSIIIMPNLDQENLSPWPEDLTPVPYGTSFNCIERGVKELPDDPAWVDALKRCTYINLSKNYLTTLPSTFYILSRIKELNLSGNNFTSFPAEAFLVGGSHKVSLYFHENPLKEISDACWDTIMNRVPSSPTRQFDLELDKSVIEEILIPQIQNSPILKEFLLTSYLYEEGKIKDLNSHSVVIQCNNERLRFDKKQTPYLSYFSLNNDIASKADFLSHPTKRTKAKTIEPKKSKKKLKIKAEKKPESNRSFNFLRVRSKK